MDLRLARGEVWLLLTATVVQVVASALYAAGLLSFPEGPPGGDVDCVEPPCGPEGVPPPEAWPIVVPVLLLGLCLVVGLAVLVSALARRARRRVAVLPGVLLAAAPVLVVLFAELVPHVVTPCRLGEVPLVCETTERHGTDWAGPVHSLGHALVGWVPAAASLWWAMSRWCPAYLPRLLRRGQSAA